MNGINLDQLFNADQLMLGTQFGMQQIVLSLFITFLIAMFIYFVYRYTYAGVLYSKNFNITLVMAALIVNMIMIGISGNIVLSLGMLGALSIVRFRTAVKDPKDTAFIFWAISVGIVNGVGFYDLAIVSTIFIAVVLVFLSKTAALQVPYVLVMNHKGLKEGELDAALKKYCKNFHVRSDARRDGGQEKVVELKVKKGMSDELVDAVKKLHGMDKVILLSAGGEIAE